MAVQSSFATIGVLCVSYFSCFTQGCRELIVETSNDELNYLNNAIFRLNPTLLADGRPVYTEIRDDGQPSRMIHHFSHDTDLDDGNVQDPTSIEFYGRWVIGGDIYSGNGWAFLPSWSIDPSHEMMTSYINSDIILNTPKYNKNQDDEQKEVLNNKDKWNVFMNNEWRQASLSDLNVKCHDNDGNANEDDTSYDALMDWLFVTYKNDLTVSWFRLNVTNEFNLNLHGFYYRITNNYYRKVDSNMYLEYNSDTNEYRFFSYFGYTDEYGIPLFHTDADTGESAGVLDPIQLVSSKANINDGGKFPDTWELVSNNTQLSAEEMEERESRKLAGEIDDSDDYKLLLNDIKIEILYRSNKDETIYDVFRNYFNKYKNESFSNSLKSSLIKSGLIKSGSNSGGYFGGILFGQTELSKEDKKKLDDISNKLFVKLNNGLTFSMVGFGTGGLGGGLEDMRKTLEDVILDIGYRVIDSASAYTSETAIGDLTYSMQNNHTNKDNKEESRKKSSLDRNDLYVITKVWPTDLGFLETQNDIFASLDKLNTNYIDLYMIHWPRCMEHFDWMDCSQASGKHYLQTWQIMEKLYSEGRILSLGVSNWDFHLWEELVKAPANQIVPQVVQNYFDIAHQDWELVEYLESWGAVYQGYATYRGVSQAQIRANTEPYYLEWKDTLTKLAQSKSVDGGLQVTDAQVILRWLVDSHIAVIPRSRDHQHAVDNWNIWGFELTEEEHTQLTEKSIEEVRKRLKQEL